MVRGIAEIALSGTTILFPKKANPIFFNDSYPGCFREPPAFIPEFVLSRIRILSAEEVTPYSQISGFRQKYLTIRKTNIIFGCCILNIFYSLSIFFVKKAMFFVH
jgi:hypothetical protein